MREELILHIDWGGLGDHLFWSHIPKAAKKFGIKKVFLANASAFRNEDYRQIWTLNPYFDGFTGKDTDKRVPVASVPPDQNLLDFHMLGLGVDDQERFHEPEFYYQPKLRPEFQDLVIYDPNYLSGVGNIQSDRIRWYLKNHGITVDAETPPRSKHYSLGTTRTVETPSLFDYCDMIYSARKFLCLTSGGATLAAALNKPSTVFFGQGQPSMFRHSRRHHYVLV